MNDPLITIRATFLLVVITGSLMYVILDYIAFKKEKANAKCMEPEER